MQANKIFGQENIEQLLRCYLLLPGKIINL